MLVMTHAVSKLNLLNGEVCIWIIYNRIFFSSFRMINFEDLSNENIKQNLKQARKSL